MVVEHQQGGPVVLEVGFDLGLEEFDELELVRALSEHVMEAPSLHDEATIHGDTFPTVGCTMNRYWCKFLVLPYLPLVIPHVRGGLVYPDNVVALLDVSCYAPGPISLLFSQLLSLQSAHWSHIRSAQGDAILLIPVGQGDPADLHVELPLDQSASFIEIEVGPGTDDRRVSDVVNNLSGHLHNSSLPWHELRLFHEEATILLVQDALVGNTIGMDPKLLANGRDRLDGLLVLTTVAAKPQSDNALAELERQFTIL